MNIAIIPARGGSKRLPGKNIKFFCGKPLIYYSIVSALHCKLIEAVYVSTDDFEIAEIAKKHGAKIIMRPKEIATDIATTTSALAHVLHELHNSGIFPDTVITLQATNPLRKPDLLNNAIIAFEEKKAEIDSLISVSENKHKLGKVENGLFIPVSYDLEQRSQDLSKLYYENGLCYITKSEVILKKESVFGDKIFPFITDNVFGSIDIDTQSDFDMGEQIFEKYKKEFNF